MSSTIADLTEERRAVLDWLRLARHQAVDSYLPDSDTVRDSCLDDIAKCDLYVLILGHRYGFQPVEDNPEGWSITQLEFRRAGLSGIPRIALLRTSIPDVRLSDLADPRRLALVSAFREEVAREVRPAEFEDLRGLIQGLSTGVAAGLGNLAGREELPTELDARLAGGEGAVDPPRQWDFFISYAQADRPWAEWIAWQLEERGYSVLVQVWDFAADSNWIAEMSHGVRSSARTIAVLSGAYLGSSYATAEWQSAWAADPSGIRHSLLVVRVADCERSGLLGGVVGVDLFGVPEATARTRLRDLVDGARTGRAKPAAPPAFPGQVVRRSLGYASAPPAFPPAAPAQVWEVAEVFQPTGVPEVTFVQPEWFAEFLMALRQPGLSIILEGPSGVGKTTLLQHAIEQDARWLSHPRTFTARDPADIAAIATWSAAAITRESPPSMTSTACPSISRPGWWTTSSC